MLSKALVFDGLDLKLVNREISRDAEALVRVRQAGICGTDLQIVRGYTSFRGVLGHEFVGVVEETDDEWVIGKRVVGEINVGCMDCDMCMRGLQRHCQNRTVLGIRGRDGAFAQHLKLPVRNLHTIPDSVEDRDAVFVEPLAAAYEILEQVQVDPSWRVAVIGDGRLGILVSQVLRTVAPQVRCFGRHERKLSILESMGIEAVNEMSHDDERSYDMVVDASGSEDGFKTMLKLVKPRGLAVLKSTIAGQYSIDMSPLVVNEVRVVGSRCGPFKPAISALARKLVRTAELVDAVYDLDNFREAFSHASKPDAVKVLLRP
ncbi:MAG: alcohol dehydrogenase catalytic domain-containing protein [Nitrososphaerota archaeon]